MVTLHLHQRVGLGGQGRICVRGAWEGRDIGWMVLGKRGTVPFPSEFLLEQQDPKPDQPPRW